MIQKKKKKKKEKKKKPSCMANDDWMLVFSD